MIIPARKLRYGFTLIELLIVIAIIGILAAAVLIAVNPAKRQNQANDANIKSDIGSIATAAQAYYTQPGAGSYPVDLNTLVTNQDLKQLPDPKDNGTATTWIYAVQDQTAGAPACAPNTGDICIEAYMYYPLFDPIAAGNVWCWESIEGKAEEESVANCIDFLAAT